MVNRKFNTIKDMMKKLHNSKCKTDLQFHKNISDYYDHKKYMSQNNTSYFEKDPFSKTG